jgi:YD repeat-containing protein
LLLLTINGASGSADPVFDAKGFQPNRELVSQLPFEHIDPMTGNVLLTFTDLVLPGNAGFDLRIQRTYNSKIYEDYGTGVLGDDSWAGLGWTLHFGRVLQPNDPDPNKKPIIEMPDGSRHQTFLHMDLDPSHFISKDFWTYEKAFPSPILRLPNGVKYTFGHGGLGALYATEIEDPFGNKIEITYAGPPAPGDVIAQIDQDLGGGQKRTIKFTYKAELLGPQGAQAAGSLATMTFNQRTWIYTQELSQIFSYTMLTNVQPPVGPGWAFGYEEVDPDSKHILTHVDSPNGGKLDYTFEEKAFILGSSVIHSPAITQRQTSGRNVPIGTWSYAYASSPAGLETEITSPCATKVKHFFLGIGQNQPFAWAVGALDKRTTADAGGAIFQTDDLTWIASVPISPLPEHVALLRKRQITRSGRPYTTEYAYSGLGYSKFRPNNFNDFGRAHTTTETGDLARTTQRTFFYGSPSDPSFGNYIVDKVSAETVQVGSESFTRSYTYVAGTGFKKSETIYGITTTYTAEASGNVDKATDANNHATTYDYDWGTPDRIQTPEYTITRVINTDGTIASETRRGFKIEFLYDALMRPTETKPPIGNKTVTTYDGAGTFIKVSRGASELTTSLDGFGRKFTTINTQLVKTELTYDSCGRLTFESHPFVGSPNPKPGITFLYDPLGRVLRRTHANNDFIAYAHLQGVDVNITDEEGRVTEQDWSAFGDPTGDARLVKVTDANDVPTLYSYNALGSLKSVTLPGGGTRTWTYNLRNELITETHPENGSTSHTYDTAGNLKTRADAQFGTTTFSYDRNDRLTGIDRPGSAYDTAVAYDASDNRTFLATADVSSAFTYDPANRLVSRTDDVDGIPLVTGYSYDLNDNLDTLTYPSGARVEYSYDSENRISRIENATGAVYADQFNHHPSGALNSYRAGNNVQHSFTYDTRYRLSLLNAGGGSRLRLTYTYDKVSNIKSIEDARGSQFSHPTLQYDDLDRLEVVSGAFGPPSFGYDPKGNRLFKQIGTARTEYTYDPVSQRLAEAEGAEPGDFTYDANGNMTGDGSGTYTYTPTNMLASAVVGTSTSSYLYDGDGVRKAKVGNQGIRYFAHGLSGQLLGEYRHNAGAVLPIREHVLAGTRLIAEVSPDVLIATPTSLQFLAILNRPPPGPKTISLTSSGGTLAWSASDNASWLTVSPALGNTPATLNVSVNQAGLTPGTYSVSITITATGAVNSPVVVPVELIVFATAQLYLSPSSVSFVRPANGPDPPAKSVQVLYPGESVQWTAQAVEPWIEVLPPGNGSTPGTLSVAIEGQGLPPGTHFGSVTVTANGVPGSPQTLAVELVIAPAAGQGCAADASYCEIFDDEPQGPLGAGWIWSEPNVPQVVPDPRMGGAGNVMLLNPPPGKRLNGDVNLAMPHAISGTEISVQLMTTGTNPAVPLSLAKIEFYTQPGRAWAKTTRTFGTLRFGSTLRFQYGPTDYAMLVNPMQPGRWYAVRVRYDGGQAQVFVDGVLKFTTAAPDADLQLEAFSLTAWDFAPGDAYVDVLQSRPGELIVEPLSLELEANPNPQCDPGIASRIGSTTGVPASSKLRTPVAFEPNRGQADPSVSFVARARGHLLLARSNDITLAIPEKRDQPSRTEGLRGTSAGSHRATDRRRVSLVRMKLGLPDRALDFQPEDPLPGRSHYLLGNDPEAWRRNVEHFGRLVAKDIYPGIDLVLRDHDGRIEYDLVVAPGADPSQIEVQFDGVTGLRVERAGDLLMAASLGQELRQPRPFVYQESGGVRRTVAARYYLRSERSVGFQLGGYDPTRPLVIDPVLAWTTQFGGPDIDEPHDIASDATGNVYVTGPAISPDLSTWHAFVTKLAANGSGIIYSTFIGGVGDWGAEGQGIAVNSSGQAVVTGPTSGGFPQVPPSMPPYGPGGLDDGFVAKLSADGSQLLFATILGGTGFEDSHGVALDGTGRIYLAGVTTSTDFPLQAPIQATRVGLADAFMTMLSSDGQQLLYSTYFGGHELQGEFAAKLAVSASGEVYFTGTTDATDFPGATGCRSDGDAFVVRLSQAGALLGSRCLGGSADDGAADISLRPGGGGPIIVGATASTDFPAVQPLGSFGGGTYDAFISEFSADLSQLLFSTSFGGSEDDEAGGVITNAGAETYVVGYTASADLPVLGPLSCGKEASANTFVVKLDANRQLIYSTFMPSEMEQGVTGFGHAVTLAPGGVYVSWNAVEDAFVAKLLDGTVPGTVHLAPSDTSVCEGDPILMRVERNGGAAGPLIVDYEPRDGTATAPADYDGTPDSVTITDMACAATLSIATVPDGVGEPAESLSVELTGVTGPATIGQPSILGATILGDGRATAQFTVSQRNQPAGPNWQAAVNVPWLTLDAYMGFGPSTVTVIGDPTGLADGTYVGRITVTATVTGSPQEILVTLTVVSQPFR